MSRLHIAASGLCCAIGYHGAAACCALRAGMAHFQDSQFYAQGEAVRVACLPDDTLWGPERLAAWIRHAVADCLQGIGDFDPARTPLLLLGPERQQPHGEVAALLETLDAAEQILDMGFDERSRIVAQGRAGLGLALHLAGQLLQERDVSRVLLVGADSYLNAATIEHYLAAGRLLVPGNSDGFIPGEAAATLLLEAGSPDRPGLQVLSAGTGCEPGRPDGSVPSRAQGLSMALGAALAQAGLDPGALEFRMSDQNGEAFFAREAAHALSRVLGEGGGRLPVLTLADCLGETGAAAGPLMLACLARLMPRDDGPGSRGLLHLASDAGARSAVVVQYTPSP